MKKNLIRCSCIFLLATLIFPVCYSKTLIFFNASSERMSFAFSYGDNPLRIVPDKFDLAPNSGRNVEITPLGDDPKNVYAFTLIGWQSKRPMGQNAFTYIAALTANPSGWKDFNCVPYSGDVGFNHYCYYVEPNTPYDFKLGADDNYVSIMDKSEIKNHRN